MDYTDMQKVMMDLGERQLCVRLFLCDDSIGAIMHGHSQVCASNLGNRCSCGFDMRQAAQRIDA